MKTHLSKIALAFLVIAGLSACGGGGGGDATPAAATPATTITVKINPPSQSVLYAGRKFNLTATATASSNLPITYSWTVGTQPVLVGNSIDITASAAGTYPVKVVASDSAGASAQATASFTVIDAVLSTPVISATALTGFKANQIISFTGSSSDPSGGTVTYAWAFGDGTTGTGATTNHTYNASGSYTVTLTASNDLGTTAKSTYTVNIDLPSAPVLKPTVLTTTVNKVETFSAASTDPNGLPLTYLWNFGDGITANTATATHAYTAAGNYTATVTVSNSNNKSSTGSIVVGVLPLNSSNTLTPACAGTNCGATSATTYSGSGVGVWTYSNNSNSPQSVNIAISGVTATNSATLVFSNASTTTAYTVPSSGSSVVSSQIAPKGLIASNAQTAPVANLNMMSLALHQDENYAHTKMLEKNHQIAQQLMTRSFAAKTSANLAPNTNAINAVIPHATPVLNTTRSWTDNYEAPVIYNNVAVKQICTLSSGRKAVFWVDPLATSSGTIKDSDVLALSATYCAFDGQGGPGTAGFDKLVSLLGDAYGTAAANYSSQLINDSAGLQDINVVILNVPSNTGWAGYFAAFNNVLKTYKDPSPSKIDYSSSNQALAFFVNATSIKNDPDYVKSTLLHESTHMINFYQRAILRGVDHDTWLEETSAMMSEDILANISLNGIDKMTSVRILIIYNLAVALVILTGHQILITQVIVMRWADHLAHL